LPISGAASTVKPAPRREPLRYWKVHRIGGQRLGEVAQALHNSEWTLAGFAPGDLETPVTNLLAIIEPPPGRSEIVRITAAPHPGEVSRMRATRPIRSRPGRSWHSGVVRSLRSSPSPGRSNHP